MSLFGGMDRGPAGDSPQMGQVVAFQSAADQFWPGIVLSIREDGWTVSLQVGNEQHDFVPYGGSDTFGEIPVGSWVTLDAYEGWKIYSEERAARRAEPAGPED